MGTFVIAQRLNGKVINMNLFLEKEKTILQVTISSLKFSRFECETRNERLKNSMINVFSCALNRLVVSFFRMILDEHEIAVSRRYTTHLLLQKGIDEIVKYTGN